MSNLYDSLPILSKPYLILIVLLLICLNITVSKFYAEYRKQHQQPKEQQPIRMKEK